MLPTRTALLVSIAIGVALEVGVTLASGRREAWDAGVYWSTGLPLAVLAAAAVGYLSRGRDWLSTAADCSGAGRHDDGPRRGRQPVAARPRLVVRPQLAVRRRRVRGKAPAQAPVTVARTRHRKVGPAAYEVNRRTSTPYFFTL